MWLNGGPGCSSLIGLFQELGPSTISPELEITRNDYSWNNNASVIFVDQPVNVGYSYTNSNTTDSSPAAADDMYALLTLFFSEFKEYASQDFHIAGESYAGHYIPAMGHRIVSEAGSNINLKSLLIGNGLTDPLTQYAYYRPMACGEGGYPSVLSESACAKMDDALPGLEQQIQGCYDGELSQCQSAFSEGNSAFFGPYQATGADVYDVRADHQSAQSGSAQWLNKKDVMEALGAEVQAYEECDNDVYGGFEKTGDWMKPIHRLVPDVLAKIPVLIYAGDADYICNWLGNQAWTKALDWPGKDAFNAAQSQPLRADGQDADYGKLWTSGGFGFAQIFQASHMVPFNQPVGSLDMLNRWIGGEWSG
jgi:cathepsin A (carboxypeptidase C)